MVPPVLLLAMISIGVHPALTFSFRQSLTE
jgi:hypothetical protein